MASFNHLIFLLVLTLANLSFAVSDDLIRELLKENIELKKKIVNLEFGHAKLLRDFQTFKKESGEERQTLWAKIEDKHANTIISKRLLVSVPAHKSPAFSASLSNHVYSLGNYQTIVFDNVFTNNGNVYSSNTGAFTAPHNGTYFFTATVMSHSGQYLETNICLNGVTKVLMYSKDSSFEQGTNSVVLYLKEGDQVWVRHNANEGSNVYGGHWSSFSGFLISD